MTRKLFVSLFAISLNFFMFTAAYSESILLKTGRKIEGKIIEKTDGYIKIDFYGVPLTYYMDAIETIDGQRPIAKDIISSEKTVSSLEEEIAPLEQKSSLWEVKSADSLVYILGSIDVLKRNIYPLNETIEAAFNKSEVLVMESNPEVEPDEKSKQLLFETAFFPDGDTLKNHLSKEILGLLEIRLALFSLSISDVERYRPFYLATKLDEMKKQKQGIFPVYGINRYFYQKAKEKKVLLGLESIEIVAKFFKSLSDSEQELLLYKTLINLDQPEKDSEQLFEAWIKGDTKGMEFMLTASQLFEDPRLKSTSEKMAAEKTKNIVTKIEGFLTAHRTFFVIVEASSLIGKKGAIELLKEKGYKVRQL